MSNNTNTASTLIRELLSVVGDPLRSLDVNYFELPVDGYTRGTEVWAVRARSNHTPLFVGTNDAGYKSASVYQADYAARGIGTYIENYRNV